MEYGLDLLKRCLRFARRNPENMFLAKTTVILSLNLYSFTNIGWSLRLLEKAWQQLFLWVIYLKFRNYKDLYEKPCKCDWMAKVVFLKQMLPTFGGRCNRCFWDIRLKILRLPNFNMLFSFCWPNFSKVNCFLVYRLRDQVMQSLLRYIPYIHSNVYFFVKLKCINFATHRLFTL